MRQEWLRETFTCKSGRSILERTSRCLSKVVLPAQVAVCGCVLFFAFCSASSTLGASKTHLLSCRPTCKADSVQCISATACCTAAFRGSPAPALTHRHRTTAAGRRGQSPAACRVGSELVPCCVSRPSLLVRGAGVAVCSMHNIASQSGAHQQRGRQHAHAHLLHKLPPWPGLRHFVPAAARPLASPS